MHGGNQTIVDSETIDAIRALTRAVGDAGESLARTSASVVLGGPYLTLLTRACGALQLKMNPASPAHDQGHEHHRHPPAARPQPTSAASHARPPGGTRYGEEHTGHDRHAGHSVEMFRDRFWITLLLSIPTLLWSDMIQMWFGYRAPDFPGSAYIPAVFGTAVYLYGGWVFLAAGVRELRDRLPGMMTLISLAISVAFFFSLAVTLGYPGEALWWELATLVTIMLLGYWIEMRSILQASGALRELAKLLPSTAQRIDGERIEDVPISDLLEGDLVLIRPGGSVPADGIVRTARAM